jgi:hypothetical protein
MEDCLTARRVVPHTDKVLYQPIRDENGVPGMESVAGGLLRTSSPLTLNLLLLLLLRVSV